MMDIRLFVFGLFFVFGGITSLNDVLIPKLKDLFVLSYGQAMLVQSAFFAAYFLGSLPAAAIVRRIGYMRGAALGLLTMTLGCILFIPAAASVLFINFLAALFVLAIGITLVQVVANPLISLLGPKATVHSRLTFAQAFNSLGTTLFPFAGSILLLSGLGELSADDPAYRAAEAQSVMRAYLGLADALLALTALVWSQRGRLAHEIERRQDFFAGFDLMRQARFRYAALCIFLYVGAEVAIGSVLVNFLERSDVWGLDALEAGKHVALYWGGAMVGRFIGSGFLRRFSPGLILSLHGASAIALLALAITQSGLISGWAILSIGLFNSIMFPTIFSLACEDLGKRAADGSGVICVMIVGGAVIPLITGMAADAAGLKSALIVPVLCYAGIAAYGWFTRRTTTEIMAHP